jgi:hypothetical protein
VVVAAPVAAPAPEAPAPVAPIVIVPAAPSPSAPPLPISADQQAQLQALDAKYSANQISPMDYFSQREAILKGQ